MSDNDRSLPRFHKPPVVETVLGVYFRAPEKFNSAEQGIFWGRHLREEYPNLEERPPTVELRERFGEECLAPSSTMRWRVTDQPDAPRLWAASENGQQVVQVQRNGLLVNWKKADDDVSYRTYEDRHENFGRQFSLLKDFFEKEGIGQIKPTSWIVTYVNHIDYEGLEDVGPAVAKTLTVWTNQFSDSWLDTPDKLGLDFTFPLPENAGRLNVKLVPAFVKKNKQHVLRLDLTARGQLEPGNIESALSAINLGHEWVVRGFASLTRPEMHKVWERIE